MTWPLAFAIAGLLVESSASIAAPRAAARSYEGALRRSIAVEGQERARFTMAERMEHYRVPGVSVAVIEDCRIVDARGFGRSAGNGPKITAHTLFQAGSISKSITAVAALKLVSQGKLPLDSDIRPILRHWNVRYNAKLSPAPITLRQLLNHTAGLNEVGGTGYPRGAPLPTLTQILDGTPPANTPPIQVEQPPGAGWRYSSGGYYIVQALMADTTGQAFPSLVEHLVLKPARMRESSFAQPLGTRQVPLAARAVGPDGSPMAGGWRINPELAAGGLWSTPSDLARFAVALARAVRGESNRLIDAQATRQLMTRELKDWGLGFDLGPPDGPRRFGHTGHNTGFVSEYVMYPDSCQGAVVMTNADQGGWLIAEILRAIGDAYGWPDRRPSPIQAAIPMTEEIARRFVGTYRLRDFPSEKFVISRKPGGALYWARLRHVGRDLLPEGEGLLFSPDSKMTLQAIGPASVRAPTLELSFGGGKNIADRID